jgi:hypothetical protein
MRHDEVNQRGRRPPPLLLLPLFEAPRHQITEAPNHRSPEALLKCLLLLSVPLDCEQERESLRLQQQQEALRRLENSTRLVPRASNRSSASNRRLGASNGWCFGALALRCFGASVPRTGARAREVVVIGLVG